MALLISIREDPQIVAKTRAALEQARQRGFHVPAGQ